MKALLLILIFTLNAIAAPENVYPKNRFDSRYIEVELVGDTHIRFSYCKKKNDCRLLGDKGIYAVKDLRSRRTKENLDVLWSALADIGIVVGLAYGGAFVGAIVGTSAGAGSASGTLLGAILGTGTGTATGATAIALVDKINPYEQYKQAETLEKNILADNDVVIDDIEKFVKRLEFVLNKID